MTNGWMDDPEQFNTAYPYPSIAVSDPHFNHDLPVNCWGCNSQALTAERALIWLDMFGLNIQIAIKQIFHLSPTLNFLY